MYTVGCGSLGEIGSKLRIPSLHTLINIVSTPNRSTSLGAICSFSFRLLLCILTLAGQLFSVSQGAAATIDVPLSNGAPYNDSLTASTPQSGWGFYYIDVPSGASSFVVDLFNMTADVDLYVRYNAKPTASTWDCRPYIGGTSERCTFSAPAAGRWWIGVNNYATGTISYIVKATWAQATSCTYAISPTSSSISSGGGNGNVSVTAGSGCAWTAGSSAAWITITAGSSGNGSGTVSYTAAANSGTSSRTGTLTIAGQTFAVSQAAGTSTDVGLTSGLPYNDSLTASSPQAGWKYYYIDVPAGASGLVVDLNNMTADADLYVHYNTKPTSTTWDCRPYLGGASEQCTFNSPAAGRWWIGINNYSSGTIGYTVRATATTTTTACTYSLSATSASFTSAATSGSVSVTAGAGCSWTASSSVAWMTTTSGGSGSGTASYSVAANTSTASRTGTLSIAGKAFTVTQAGSACSYSISPTSASFTSLGGALTVSVTTGAGCTWTATSGAGWITITAGASGNGNGTVNYSVAANTSTSSRTGTMTVAGKTFSVSQMGAAATDNPPAASLMSPAGGATISGTTTFTGTATDDVGVAKVEFWCDGTLLLGTATVAPYSISYNTANIPGGMRSFTCKAYDTAGHSTTSAANSVTVNNTVQLAGSWAKRFGGVNYDKGAAVAADSSGNILVTGFFSGTADFGGGTLTSIGTSDMFLAKYSAAGVLLWAKRFGGPGAMVSPNAIVIDANGNITVGGGFSGSVDLGRGALTSAGGMDIFLSQYLADGTPQWAKRFGGTDNEYVSGLAVDKRNGELVLAGTFVGLVDFSGGIASPLTSYWGGRDCFVARYSSTGVHVWSKNFNNISDDVIIALAVDRNGDIVFTGTSNAFINFGGYDLQNPLGGSVMVLVKLSSGGLHKWSKAFNSAAPKGLAVDANGSIFVTGIFRPSVDVGGGTLTSAGYFDIFLAKYDTLGNHVKSKALGGNSYDYSTAVAVDPVGNVVLFGYFLSYTWLGGQTLYGTGGYDILLAKYSTDLNHIWSETYGGAGDELAPAVTVDGAGCIIGTGAFPSSAAIAGASLTSAGSCDAYLLRHQP